MIDPCSVRALTRKQLKQLRNIDFDCEGMDCVDCPLCIEPQREKTKANTIFTFTCVSAYARHLLEK